ncbi:hypothetical protein ACHAQK_003723 [Fusarium lateritium]
MRLDRKDAEREWSSLVAAYSSRNLTFGSDKLIAFSAIPQTLGRSFTTGPQHLAQPTSENLGRESIVHLLGPGLLLMETSENHVELSDTRAPFGAVVSGYLLVKGFTRQAKFFPAVGQLSFIDENTAEEDQERTQSEYGAFADCLPDEQIRVGEGREESVDVVCLRIRNYGGHGEGLILVEDVNESVFRRIEHFYWSEYDNNSGFISSTFQLAKEGLLKIV